MVILYIAAFLIIFVVYKFTCESRNQKNRFKTLVKRIPSPKGSKLPFVGHFRLLREQIESVEINQKICSTLRPQGNCALNLGLVAAVQALVFKAALMNKENIKKSPMYDFVQSLVNGGLLTGQGDTRNQKRKNTSFKMVHLKLSTVKNRTVADIYSEVSKYTLKPLLEKDGRIR